MIMTCTTEVISHSQIIGLPEIIRNHIYVVCMQDDEYLWRHTSVLNSLKMTSDGFDNFEEILKKLVTV